MDYGRMLSQSFQLAWRYKGLWIFGLFAGWGSTFYFDLSDLTDGLGIDSRKWRPDMPFDIDFEALAPLLSAVILALLFMALVFLVMHLISVPTLVDAVNRITRGGRYSVSASFSRGVDCFWRYLGLFLLSLAFVVVTIVIVVLLVITIVGIVLAVPLAIFAIYFSFTLIELARRAIVVRDCSIGDALSEAYWLLKKHFGRTVVAALIVLGLSIAFSIGTFIMWLIVGMPIGLLVYAMTASVAWAAVLGLLIGLPISLVVGGYLGTFFTSFYTMFYFELVEPSTVAAVGAPPASGPPPEGPPIQN